jgi:hypothetical protein
MLNVFSVHRTKALAPPCRRATISHCHWFVVSQGLTSQPELDSFRFIGLLQHAYFND